jgi:hypothetical protein
MCEFIGEMNYRRDKCGFWDFPSTIYIRNNISFNSVCACIYLAVDPDPSVSAGLQGLMCFEHGGGGWVTELKVGRLAANIGPVRTIIWKIGSVLAPVIRKNPVAACASHLYIIHSRHTHIYNLHIYALDATSISVTVTLRVYPVYTVAVFNKVVLICKTMHRSAQIHTSVAYSSVSRPPLPK